jgi:hypothetical protein
MPSVRSLKSILTVAIAASLTTVFAVSTVFAASGSTRQPVILDSQNGISDGQSGTVLQTAPLSRQLIVEAQPIAAPTELAPNSSTQFVVEPYIQVPAGGGTPPSPQPRPALRLR